MMGPGGITVALAMYWLTGVVGAASLPPDDQYSPQQSPYRRVFAQGPRGYSTWLKYQQDLATRSESSINNPDPSRVDVNDFSRERISREDSVIRDVDLVPLALEGWQVATTDVKKNTSKSARVNLDVLKDTEISSVSVEDDFVDNDSIEDQGPGSVEVYKLDLHRENSLLVPHANEKQPVVGARTKSKIPKKATAKEILWKLKSINSSKVSLPVIFQQASNSRKDSTLPRQSRRKMKENRKDENFAVGGVPELQVGCEGLEASQRDKRSSGSSMENMDERDWDNSHKYQDPIYRESTEPILLRVTPIILDLDEEEPPSGETYEELDELLKLKQLENTSPEPTTKRWNRADIEPALEMDKHREEDSRVETFPERGDLGPSNGSSSEVKGTIIGQQSEDRGMDKVRFGRSLQGGSLNHQGGRRLHGVQYPAEVEKDANEDTKTRHHQDAKHHSDLWGFGEEEGDELDKHGEEDSRVEKFPERGDLGSSNGSSSEVKGTIIGQESEDRGMDKVRFGRSLQGGSLNHQGGRRLLWVQYPAEGEKDANEDTKTRHHQDAKHHSDLWGFGEEDGDELDSEEDAELDKLREAEVEKRRREYERRRQEELDRRRGGGHGHHRPHEDHPSRSGDANSEIERIRKEYERQLEEQRRERQRVEEEVRRQGDRRRGGGDDRRRMEEARRQQEEESRRRLDEEQRRNPEPWNSRRREEEDREWTRRQKEEAERLRRLENQRNDQDPPSSLTRPESSPHYLGNNSRSRQDKMAEEEKLREYIERNRPIDPKKTGERQRPNEPSRRNENDERRRHMEEQRRRQMEEERRRQHQPNEDERRKQMEEQRRGNRPESRPMEEERRHRLEEERKLQEYVRRNQPVNVPRRNNSEASISSQENRDLEEQRRTMEAARQWERNRQAIVRTDDGRIHGPSAPTSIGQRPSQYDLEEARRRQERIEQERRRELDWRRLAEEEQRRAAEIQRAESRRHEEERKRMEAAVRRDEENRRAQLQGRRNSWQESQTSRPPAIGSRRYDTIDEVRDREAEELRRRGSDDRTLGNSARNRDDEWRRRAEERERQREQQEERERHRLANERNSRNNGRRRPHHEDRGPHSRQRGEIVRGDRDEIEWRRREHARLSSLPVRATIILRSDDASKNGGGGSHSVTLPTPLEPLIPSIGSRGNFDNEIDFPGINPNRPGLAAPGFPAPPTSRPPVKSPGACVWAIVQCCPANNRLTSCFESMGCPGVNWDPNPCRGSLANAARAEVVRFYEAADAGNTRF